MIKVGDTLPATTLMEFSEVEGNGCSIGPNAIDVAKGNGGQNHRSFRPARGIHTYLLRQTSAGLHRELF